MLSAKLEWRLLREEWRHFALLLPAAVLVHNAAHNAVFWRWNAEHMYRYAPLPDLIMSDSLHVPAAYNTARMGTFVMMCVAAIGILFLKNGHSSVLLFRRFVCVYAAASALRCVTFFVTLLPGTASYCVSHELGGTYTPARAPHSWHDVFFRFDWTHACGDLLYSGHTALVVCMYLSIEVALGGAWDRFAVVRTRAEQWWCTLQILALYSTRLKLGLFLYTTVRARKHYSIDVLIACYVTCFLWLILSPHLPTTHPAETKQLPCTCCTRCATVLAKA